VHRILRADRRQLVVNEMAPRPHNSGHYTMDACVTSQFAQQVRAMARLPLGDVRQHSPAVMLNILGDVWFADGSDVAANRPGTRCWRCRAPTCTCTARTIRAAAARWAT
jgi:phosphoribosylaminoimidazole carboxylase (NCAIR synthetase)